MACILHLETSTSVCSVALSDEGRTVFEKVSCEGPSHAALLGVFTEEAIAFTRAAGRMPDAVALSSGPGSYTGLRIGTSLAKGLCMGWGVPLIAVPTLKVMALRAIRHTGEQDGLYCAMLDARRMEVYAAIYDVRLQTVRETRAEVVTPETYRSFLDRGTVYFFGNGAPKCHTLITSANALFPDNIHPLATDMAPLAETLFREQAFEDPAYFEPFYLKGFIPTTPKELFQTGKRPV
ncbi:MAG: tRNA (adenosine(37)-N6)-threonylcarbamoyltransferase complex dimerization subunit type 1 TsaB [Tannerella sp.]|jgi:tRNA threonylcarbamoyladenosine biosynthesis protein TsaB|nr:tRNA (adenosine(37)-N6)-threonylcarbamoyltransferase complex dimerization subunit type 1 TsaB [Tannerella sp.]